MISWRLFLLSLCTGYILDLLVGDPYHFPHPIRVVGHSISWVEQKVRKYCVTPRALRIGGAILWVIIVGGTYGVVGGIVLLSKSHPTLYVVINSYLIYTILATKCLADEAKKIYITLGRDTLVQARKQLSYIVGRDTSQLEETEIIRATVETVAENTVDGVVAPLFYLVIGGAPLAYAYKAINTLDSMVGYKNEKYKEIGLVSAKLDDLANLIPARLSIIWIAMASKLVGYKGWDALRIAIRDRKNHKSPNCAYPEGAVAGALGVQLGGTNVYFGEQVYKPTIGDKLRDLNKQDILATNKILYGTSVLTCLSCILVLWLIGNGI